MEQLRGRSAILQVHAKGKPLETSVTLETLAKQTPGFSGADLANLLNEAAILALHRQTDLADGIHQAGGSLTMDTGNVCDRRISRKHLLHAFVDAR